MEHTIGIKSEYLSSIASILNVTLADEFLLYTKTLNAHWNIEGPDFFEKHKYFESQYEELIEIMDALAERIRTIDHFALATLKGFLQVTHLSEESAPYNDSKSFIKVLLNDHESIIIYLRRNIRSFADEFHDQGTSDFITGILEKHEKMAWMLREQLK